MSGRSAVGPWWRWGRRALIIVGLALLVFLWPTRLGGATDVVIVTGDSMRPFHEHGDVVIVRHADEYRVGDVVVYSVPSGPASGLRVIHRIVAIAADGAVTTRGDNRDTDDAFPITLDDIDGKAVVEIPRLGRLMWLASRWTVLIPAVGILAASLAWSRSEAEDSVTSEDP